MRRNTTIKKNSKIDEQTLENIRRFSKSSSTAISDRISKLDKEWDIERVLETNMSILALTGLALGVYLNIYWFILPGVVLLFFLQHALQGWCPPVPVFRAFKVRTRPEIDREKYALKVLRGDFNNLDDLPEQMKASSALEAVKKI
ncbi:hypothetical protein ACH3O9_11110 [Leeuwenhoekiella sp. A16]|uniref:hypothetical protein n=1 Tax=unclassified Leeuwenhoekiella TaxID=2615029 RepID=UPI003A806666